jgi:hypothetical protein
MALQSVRREIIGSWKYIHSDFTTNGSPNKNLESGFKKDS